MNVRPLSRHSGNAVRTTVLEVWRRGHRLPNERTEGFRLMLWQRRLPRTATTHRGGGLDVTQVLPIADTSSNVGLNSIEARLERRMSANSASESLEASMDTARMFVAQPTDCVTDVNAFHQPIEAHLDHTENFQKVFRRLRQTGRNDDQRDASDSMKKVMQYLEKKKTSK